ncbi:MAG TPA: thiaminase II [Mycobacteriales bacterium]|jgi:thiaminase/transcriptional activator TenA|nr:thiaminase II [Mycobacteriales bacterium]
MNFCAEVWTRTADLQQAILDHPFNRALADGTLDRDRFHFYLAQDSRYLVGFSQALAAASTRAENADDAAFYAHSAQTALIAERTLHAGYLEGIDVSGIATAPSALAYVSFLHSVALTGGYAELVAAVLPCFWVYAHVGSHIAAGIGRLDGHPYERWIATYADESFAASVQAAKGIADRVAADAGPAVRDRMTAAFVRGCEYEWMFWDAAWRQEAWPTRGWLERPAAL